MSTPLPPIPVGQHVIVRRDEVSSQTEAGIFIPEAAKQKSNTGIVHAISPDSMHDYNAQEERWKGGAVMRSERSTTQLHGQRVVFGAYAGSEVIYNGVPWLIIHDSDIIAILPETSRA